LINLKETKNLGKKMLDVAKVFILGCVGVLKLNLLLYFSEVVMLK
jgi:hypothetical protein